MATATKAKDLASHQAVLADAAVKNSCAVTCAALAATLAGKKFADLTTQEKDDALKALLLKFNLIAPD